MVDLVNLREGVPLRLYYNVASYEVADAEVVARASLAFIAGVKEIAYILDPSLSVRIGLEGHSEGSLWEDFLLFSGKARKEYLARPIRYNLALAAIVWIMSPPAERIRDNLWAPILDRHLPEASSQERAETARVIEIASRGNIATREKQQFYRETSRDTNILEVAANLERVRPPLVVPRSDFPLYSGVAPTLESDVDRTTVASCRLTIVSPVLEVSTTRRWKLAGAQGEFGAAVKDKDFLERIVAGRTSVKMRGGVQLDVQLETKEHLTDGVWVITERNVLHVEEIIEPPSSGQGSLLPEGDG